MLYIYFIRLVGSYSNFSGAETEKYRRTPTVFFGEVGRGGNPRVLARESGRSRFGAENNEPHELYDPLQKGRLVNQINQSRYRGVAKGPLYFPYRSHTGGFSRPDISEFGRAAFIKTPRSPLSATRGKRHQSEQFRRCAKMLNDLN